MKKTLTNTWTTIQTFVCLLGLTTDCIHEAVFHKEKGRYLANSVIRREQAETEFDCTTFCTRENSCVSVNYKISGENQGLCELNSETLSNSKENEKRMAEFSNLEIVKRTCKEAYQSFSPKTKQCFTSKSCKDLLAKDMSLKNGVYYLQHDIYATQYSVYCHMTEIPGCGQGGWTLVMKLDGNKSTFLYNSSYWTNTRTYNVQDGLNGLNDKESKLESYWSTSFTKICVGMKVKTETKWINLDYEAVSFHSVIADEKYKATNAGKSTWKSLITDSSLQKNCNKEGFNIFSKVTGQEIHTMTRLGFTANNENNCNTCDSLVGFGFSVLGCSNMATITTGNYATCENNDNGHKETGAVGYILVQ